MCIRDRRYLVSLSDIDHLILMLVALMLLFGAAILFFVMLSSSYFVSSIIHPVTEIGQAARRIALGEYDYRIEKQYDDEIGELCDTINYMACLLYTSGLLADLRAAGKRLGNGGYRGAGLTGDILLGHPFSSCLIGSENFR